MSSTTSCKSVKFGESMTVNDPRLNMDIDQHTGAEVRFEVDAFYKTVGYHSGVGQTDMVIAARDDGTIVGVTRLCKEEDTLVLRGLYVAAELRGRGIGSKLLRVASERIGQQECWCVPFTHLRDFYSTAGFSECRDSAVPNFLLTRVRGYIAKGMDVIIMKRPGQDRLRSPNRRNRHEK